MDNVYCAICGAYKASCVHGLCSHLAIAFNGDNHNAGFEPCGCDYEPIAKTE